ncbi:hypothetical protein VOLCADRAFT_100332 [Volvox carteri f. nagariensis]|uniref:Uncharacterized protein n=1 Tax=Volvox carteri f. nagariensis TaxID=3068 RepID=D8UK09_VOLCA|nr:uncharacterized protein VOLCADRAFT_100332 [Volvox carteri f. nagariensis]EFJ39944.1 hypothetical protein VOLCADRAFT_100332 [Volvox carteri f. nagariensis]|eukprot:XP_002958996.1 hypothetical protein VOLCADRAFT_100332 [Volvox carteri f. nagariensis]
MNRCPPCAFAHRGEAKYEYIPLSTLTALTLPVEGSMSRSANLSVNGGQFDTRTGQFRRSTAQFRGSTAQFEYLRRVRQNNSRPRQTNSFVRNKIQANSATELFPNSSPNPTLLVYAEVPPLQTATRNGPRLDTG